MPAVKTDHIPQLLAKIETYEGELNTRLGLKMLALTFVRTNELIGAEWTEFDIEDAMRTIPGARMKKVRGKAKVHVDCDQLVPLARQTIAIPQELRGLNGESRYLFAGRNASTCMSNNTLLFALYPMGYRRRMSGHNFRAIASTILNEESSFTSDVIEDSWHTRSAIQRGPPTTAPNMCGSVGTDAVVRGFSGSTAQRRCNARSL